MKKESLLGIPVHGTTLGEAVNTAMKFLKGKKQRIIHTANANVLTLAQRDKVLRRSFITADILLPDGQGAVLGSKIFGKGKIRQKVAGPDFFLTLTAVLGSQNKPVKFFFLGSSPSILEKIKKNLTKLYPNIKYYGHSPPFKPEFSKTESQKMISAINKAKPDVLWVGMTAPKQEKWIEINKKEINAKLIATVGAAFDLFAGTTKRSPKWIMKLLGDTEFIYRFAANPRKMFRRSMRSAVKYPYLLAKHKLFK